MGVPIYFICPSNGNYRQRGVWHMVTIYTTPTCPKCKVLKGKMESKGVEYSECQDVDKMISMGISTVPWLEVDGKLMDFVQANNWVNNL